MYANPYTDTLSLVKKEKDEAGAPMALDRKQMEQERLKRKRGNDGLSPMKQPRPPKPDLMGIDQKVTPPHNLYEGNPMAKQLAESLEVFLQRLKPSVTTVASGPWIWIANPSASNRHIYRNQPRFVDEGNAFLDVYMARKKRLEEQNPSSVPSTITRKLKPEREWLEESLTDLAKQCSVTNGKWMLFPMPNEVDKVWATVAKGTLEGRLGSAAKVATDASDGKDRLVRVYTEDFTDVQDVKRVLKEMRRLGLVGGRGIYYKTDAYTYLDIRGDNEYKLRASKYSSKDMLQQIDGDDI